MNAVVVERMGQVLGSAYPRWEAGEGTWLVFAKVVEHLDPDAVLAACWSWVHREKWPPAPSELKAEAEKWDRYLREGPQIELCRVRIQGDSALGPVELQDALDRWPALADLVQQQTGKSAQKHLDDWREEAARHKAKRRHQVQQAAQGNLEATFPDHLLLSAATTHPIPEETP